MMPGMVTTRVPPAAALVRARVWVSDLAVAHRATSADAMAAATAEGGSSPATRPSGITSRVVVAPSSQPAA